MKGITIFFVIGINWLCNGQTINQTETSRRDLAYIENYVLENIREPIMILADSRAKRQCANIGSQSEEIEIMKQELAELEKNLNMFKETTLMAVNKSSSEFNQSELDVLRSEVKEANKKLYMLMGRLMEVQDQQSSQEKLFQRLMTEFNVQKDLSERKYDALTRDIKRMDGKINKLNDKPTKDCHDLFLKGNRENGIYSISPDNTSFDVYCDMDEGGWTVLQRRFNGSENFNRTWEEYVNGFGDLNGEFWLGLEKMHMLTLNPNKVKFDFTLDSMKTLYIWYGVFSVGNATSDYTLRVSGYINGLKERTFSYNNGQRFATYDRDNKYKCGKKRYGGWWYDNCTWLNINGRYGLKNDETGMTEHCCSATFQNFISTMMKIQ